MTAPRWLLGAVVLILLYSCVNPLGIPSFRGWLGGKLRAHRGSAEWHTEGKSLKTQGTIEVLKHAHLHQHSQSILLRSRMHQAADFKNEEAIHVAYIICWNRRDDEFFASLKSLHLFAKSSLKEEPAFYHVHIISNEEGDVNESSLLKPRSNFRMTMHMTTLDAPEMFAACAMQDLYIHEMEDFQHIDRLLFVDIDTLWLDDPRGWWALFEDMRAQGALFGMAAEGGSWYAGHSIPYYGQDSGKSGLNSGALMMDLARIRKSNFSAERDAIINEWSVKQDLIQLGPQDVLNIYGAFHPDHIYEMPCVYNFRHYSGCRSDSGFPVILHGNGHLKDLTHSSQSRLTYQHLYNVFSELQF